MCVACHLFDEKVPVQCHGLRTCQRRKRVVEVSPAGLDQSNLLILQKQQERAPQPIRFGDKIGIEDGNVVALCVLQAELQSPSFEMLARGAA